PRRRKEREERSKARKNSFDMKRFFLLPFFYLSFRFSFALFASSRLVAFAFAFAFTVFVLLLLPSSRLVRSIFPFGGRKRHYKLEDCHFRKLAGA
ncbi:MAG: hypothetical protein ACNA7J_10580, partial [Wenzhouxiangella sp.]